MNKEYITITQLTRYIKYKIDNDQNLMSVYLKGEISNFKAHTRGHFYFTLKDENSRINAIMFATNTMRLNFVPTDGMKVLVSGKISVYEATGNYQIYVDSIIEDGLGNLYVAFEKLKKKLELDGLFDLKYKKSLPKMPQRIGIITAPTGAAIKDILSTIKRRWPICEAILFPSLVQGNEAAADIVQNINLAKNFNLDLLIVGRGGGSIEDLWCFNEEIVARAIFDLDIPVISAVGHEIDFTIADFVADLRAPTPTGAAEMAVPNKTDVLSHLEQLKTRCITSLLNLIKNKNEKLFKLQDSYILKNPLAIYQVKEEKFSNIFEKLLSNYRNIIIINRNILENTRQKIDYNIKNLMTVKINKYQNIINKLEALNPILTLKRGYAIIRNNDKVIGFSTSLKKKDIVTIELQDGQLKAEIL